MGSKEMDEVLGWEETKALAHQLRQHGVRQFVSLYRAFRDRDGDPFLWGDETEYFVVKLDRANRKAVLSLRVLDILQQLQQIPKSEEKAIWKPEFGAFQIEGIPLRPYSGDVSSMLTEVEANMKMRREILQRHLTADEALLTLATFPRSSPLAAIMKTLGCGVFTEPLTHPEPTAIHGSRSIFISDEAISKAHPRFVAGAHNVRLRRQEKIAINIPIFKDVHSPAEFVEQLADEESQLAAKVDHIYMDCMTFGCSSSLQVTMQAKNLAQARHLYDQLAVMCPIVLALSASSPVHRGFLSSIDCRWDVLSAAKDDRTKEERALEPLQNNRFVIPKSRHDSIDYFLSPMGQKYNDVRLIYDEDIYQQLKDAEVDDVLSRHVAHLFIRDPLTLLRSNVTPPSDPPDPTYTEHFENLQSTNWQSMRLKPPPFHSDIGWRVEFRTCEVQVSNYENSCYALFIILLAKAIIELNLNLLLPLSKVEENMRLAQKMDAVVKETFWFRNNIRYNDEGEDEEVAAYAKMTIDAIINGDQKSGFPGLLPLITRYVESSLPEVTSEELKASLLNYMAVLSGRASGAVKTTARWTRDFVHAHPAYRMDSVVSDRIAYDMLRHLVDRPAVKAEVAKAEGGQVEVDLWPSRQCQLSP